MQVEQQPTLSDEELTYFARIGCGGDNVRWSFSEAGLRRTLASFAAAILSRASSAGTAPAIDLHAQSVQCPDCNGYGRVNDGSGGRSPYAPKCPTCGGTGRVHALVGGAGTAPEPAKEWDEKCVLGHCNSPGGCERDMQCRANLGAGAAPAGGVTPTDTQLLNMVRDESMDLRSFVMPTGAGDADIGWRVISFHMDEPKERTVAEAFHDDPREALRQAYMAHTFNRVALGPVGSSGEAPKPQQSQSAWATRQKLARDGARDVLAKEEAQEGGEPRGMALENALRNIEEACNYSPYREMDKWDAPLAQLIHHHARLLAAAALKEQ